MKYLKRLGCFLLALVVIVICFGLVTAFATLWTIIGSVFTILACVGIIALLIQEGISHLLSKK